MLYSFFIFSDNLRKKPAPRLFCDICDVFDQHDTEDCPKQAMEDEGIGTQHHGNRGEERPYCVICEGESKQGMDENTGSFHGNRADRHHCVMCEGD